MKKLFAMLVGFVLAIFLAVALVLFNWNSSYERELQAWRDAGGKLSIVDYLPEPPPANENAATFYLEAVETAPADLTEEEETMLAEPAEADPAALAPLLDRYAEALRLVEIGSQRDICVWSTDEAALHQDFAMLGGAGGEIRRLAQVLAAQAVLDEQAGATSDALQSVLTGLRLADHIAAEPLLVSALISLAVERLMLERLEATDVVTEGYPAELDVIQAMLDSRDYHALARRAILGDGTLGIAMLRREMQQIQNRPLIGSWWRINEAELLRFMRRSAELTTLPYHEASRNAVDLPSRVAVLAGTIAPSVDRFCAVVATESAYAKLATSAIELRQHHVSAGAWPGSLDEISGEFIDPVTGRPFGFERTEEGIRLWSEAPPSVTWDGEPVEWEWPPRPEPTPAQLTDEPG